MRSGSLRINDAADYLSGRDNTVSRQAAPRHAWRFGMPDPGRADAIMYRVLNKIEYEGVTDVWRLAAMHLLAISRGHIFNDGNKRTALFITLLFLKRNGIILPANPDFVGMTVEAAAGQLTLEQIVARLRG